MIEPYSADELNQIAEALSVPLNHEAVQRVHDLATRFIIHHEAQEILTNAKETEAQLSKIAAHAGRLITSLADMSPETRLFLGRAGVEAPLSNLESLEDWLRKTYDAAKIAAAHPQGAAPQHRRDQLWTDLADLFEGITGNKLSRDNPDSPANKFIRLCCEDLPGKQAVSDATRYDAVQAMRAKHSE